MNQNKVFILHQMIFSDHGARTNTFMHEYCSRANRMDDLNELVKAGWINYDGYRYYLNPVKVNNLLSGILEL